MKKQYPSQTVGSGQRLILPNTPNMSPDCAVIFTFLQEEDWKISSVPKDNSSPEQRVVRVHL